MVTATLSIFNLPVWNYILQMFTYLADFCGFYTFYFLVIITLMMFIYFVRFIARRLRLH